jgi:hypothetical protein
MTRLDVNNLPFIDDILKKLDFLEYSTQKRNLAYRIQFQAFLSKIFQNYEMYGSVESMFISNFYDYTVNILEYLLWIAVEQEYKNFSKEKDTKQQLRKITSELGIISRGLSHKIQKIFGKRDKIHPSKQKELDITTFSRKDFIECFEATEDLIVSLEKYFKKKKLPPLPPQEEICSYCCAGGPFEHEDICPACGEVVIY